MFDQDYWDKMFTADGYDEAIPLGHQKLVEEAEEWEQPSIRIGGMLGEMEQSLQMIWPEQTKGETKDCGDHIIWTCEEGAIDATKPGVPYTAAMTVAPEDAPYYCGWCQWGKFTGKAEMKEKGYDKLGKGDLSDMLPQTVGMMNVLKALESKRKGIGEAIRWFKEFKMYSGMYLETDLDREIAIKALMYMNHDQPLSLEHLAGNKDLLEVVRSAFGRRRLKGTIKRHTSAMYYVPQWMFDMNKKLVAKGWPVLTPQWLGAGCKQYNHGIDGGCGGDFLGYRCYPELSERERRLLMTTLQAYNLHVAYDGINQAHIQPDPEWEALVQSQAAELCEGEPGTEFSESQRRSFGVSLVRNLPILMKKNDKRTDYIRLVLRRPGVREIYQPHEVDVFSCKPNGDLRVKLADSKKTPLPSQARLKYAVKGPPVRIKELLTEFRKGGGMATRYRNAYGPGMAGATKYIIARLEGERA